MNPLVSPQDQTLLNDHHIHIEVDAVQRKGIIIIQDRRFKISLLSYNKETPDSKTPLSDIEVPQLTLVTKKIAVMLLKKNLLNFPYQDPLNFNISDRGITKLDEKNLITHEDPTIDKNTRADYDALVNYLILPNPPALAAPIEKGEVEEELEAEHPQNAIEIQVEEQRRAENITKRKLPPLTLIDSLPKKEIKKSPRKKIELSMLKDALSALAVESPEKTVEAQRSSEAAEEENKGGDSTSLSTDKRKNSEDEKIELSTLESDLSTLALESPVFTLEKKISSEAAEEENKSVASPSSSKDLPPIDVKQVNVEKEVLQNTLTIEMKRKKQFLDSMDSLKEIKKSEHEQIKGSNLKVELPKQAKSSERAETDNSLEKVSLETRLHSSSYQRLQAKDVKETKAPSHFEYHKNRNSRTKSSFCPSIRSGQPSQALVRIEEKGGPLTQIILLTHQKNNLLLLKNFYTLSLRIFAQLPVELRSQLFNALSTAQTHRSEQPLLALMDSEDRTLSLSVSAPTEKNLLQLILKFNRLSRALIADLPKEMHPLIMNLLKNKHLTFDELEEGTFQIHLDKEESPDVKKIELEEEQDEMPGLEESDLPEVKNIENVKSDEESIPEISTKKYSQKKRLPLSSFAAAFVYLVIEKSNKLFTGQPLVDRRDEDL